jgi:hydroxymethylglutaryl-CoA synthase
VSYDDEIEVPVNRIRRRIITGKGWLEDPCSLVIYRPMPFDSVALCPACLIPLPQEQNCEPTPVSLSTSLGYEAIKLTATRESTRRNQQAGTMEKNVGILAIEVYTPSTYVSQAKLEEHSGVSQGRYTIGLGQNGLAVTGDAEDINSLCLTAVHSLLEKYDIDPSHVGRLEVGTETLVDKSKSTKTVLMDLFPGNTDIEGATIVNACYGGTAALLNAFLWVESDGWDGRYAIVVAADIAAYARGPARPTCGAGAVAVLIGRDAPLSFHPRERATHASHVWDFFKPDHTVEYPAVDGALSQTCYYQALEDVYTRFAKKMEETDGTPFDAESPDYMVFHAPYNKLVQKSYARLYLMDARRKHELMDEEEKKGDEQPLAEWLAKPIEETYTDRNLETALKNLSALSFKKRLVDANVASREVGNTYTASVFLGLSSLVDRVGRRGELIPGKKIVVFSYGSGALATMYRLHV